MLSGKQLPDTDVTDITDITDIHVAKVVAKIATCCGENLIGLTAAQAAHNKHMNFGQIWTCHPAMPGIVQSLGKLKSNKALVRLYRAMRNRLSQRFLPHAGFVA